MATRKRESGDGDQKGARTTGETAGSAPGAGAPKTAGGARKSARTGALPATEAAPETVAKSATRGRGGAAAKEGAAAKGAVAKRQPRATRVTGEAETTTTAAAPRRKQPNLRADLRDFVAARPEGWGHEDWLHFLEHLQSRGHNIGDREAIGAALERERLAYRLERVEGIGAQRIQAIADRFGYLWRLKQADVDEIAREANLPRPLAERVAEAARG